METDPSAHEKLPPSSPIRRRRIFASAVLLVIATVAISNWPETEPKFSGRPLSSYFPDLILPHSNTNYSVATNVLLSAGSEAFPVVLKHIQNRVPWHVKLYFNQRTNLPSAVDKAIQKYATPSFYQTRYRGAIEAVGILGTNAEPIVEDLVLELPRTDYSFKGMLADGLARIGPPVVEPIKPLLTSPDMRTRSLAAFICHRLGRNALEAVPELVAGLKDGDLNHQRLVGQTLARMGNEVLPTLLQLLAEDDTISIHAGLAGAGGILIQPSILVQSVASLLEHPDADVRREAAMLLLERWPGDADAIARALRARAETDERVKDYLWGIEMIQNRKESLIKILHEGVDQPEPEIKIKCLAKLVHLDPDRDKVRQELEMLNSMTLSKSQQLRVQNLIESINAIRY